MQYPRAVWKSFHCFLSSRRVFTTHKNAALRQKKTIKAVVQHHDLSVLNISNEKLIQILQYLLREGVFSSNNIAWTIFPELFQPLTLPVQEVPKPPSPQTSIMQEFILDEYADAAIILAKRVLNSEPGFLLPAFTPTWHLSPLREPMQHTASSCVSSLPLYPNLANTRTLTGINRATVAHILPRTPSISSMMTPYQLIVSFNSSTDRITITLVPLPARTPKLALYRKMKLPIHPQIIMAPMILT